MKGIQTTPAFILPNNLFAAPSAATHRALPRQIHPSQTLDRLPTQLNAGSLSSMRSTQNHRFHQSTKLFAVPNAHQYQALDQQTVAAWKAEVSDILHKSTQPSDNTQAASDTKERALNMLASGTPLNYILTHSPEEAAATLLALDNPSNASPLSLSAVSEVPSILSLTADNNSDNDTNASTFTLSVLNQPHTHLDKLIHVLNELGFEVIASSPYAFTANDQSLELLEMSLAPSQLSHRLTNSQISSIQALFSDSLNGSIEVDALNSLALTADLAPREISNFRALNHYSRQIFSPELAQDLQAALVQNPAASKAINHFFNSRFDPKTTSTESDALESAKGAIQQVQNPKAFKALNTLVDLIQATDRTNLFQTDDTGQTKSRIAFKVAPTRIPGFPKPTPRNEIFVYSPTMEGVHLRFGEMSRGGLRWSDRPDFHTEVYGLAKAQQVKNSVVVPMGSKGGFIVKQNLQGEAFKKAGVDAYKTLLNGMLDLTDTRQGSAIIPPKQVVCHDRPDPYLVVAADKGTATFSDIGNSVSESRGFWLGDAFASGGQFGYDHKKMGITAKGAWKSVERHFKEIGKDIQSEPFTTIGIGSMSGDVFGNGMLMSDKTQLTAAISTKHIFIDPNPDTDVSYQERSRLFAMGRSTWQDYNPSLISAGGGVFDRSARSIPISAEMKARFHIEADTLSGEELVNQLLKAPTDLLWNGAVGTYIKASDEDHAAANDKNNDAIRVNANDVQAKIIGEGGNLGLTQKARIEFSLQEGRVNTDFIDNVSGVDCSDHEVNTKIILNPLVSAGHLTFEARNELLASMTDEVADAVLSNNYWQNLGLSLAEQEAKDHIDRYIDQMDALESTGHDRKTYQLPSNAELTERQSRQQSLTRPELAYIISHSKNELTEEILKHNPSDLPTSQSYLFSAFPQTLVKKFTQEVINHPLKDHIIATQMSNRIVNIMGPTYINSLHLETGQPKGKIISALLNSFADQNVEAKLNQFEANENETTAQAMLEQLNQLKADVHQASYNRLKA